jgi:hypothetical protein
MYSLVLLLPAILMECTNIFAAVSVLLFNNLLAAVVDTSMFWAATDATKKQNKLQKNSF